ncbi:hypothetical protein OSB04_028930 [Centaurea solstitialis]|uniref:CCHC-type domain-containing protein n=1 Tax=Centaurea solstitialis TaxID=347529 RepID=A0AA38SIA9_9ASTR|nr:hypothetical protein OSB04_028930 [Centaurea solstitialis]
MEDKFLKRDHTDQTIHMNQPKEFNYYNPKEGIGYKSPCYLKRAISKTPTLYDLRYMSLGYKIIFMKESDDPEQLKEIEKKEKARKTKQSFPFNYSSLNASYATREIPLSKDYTPSHTEDEINQEVPILEKVYKDNQTFYERRIAKLEAELEDERRMSLREKDLFLSKINELEKALKSKSTPTASQSTFGTRDNSRHHHHRWNVNALDFRPSSTSSTNSKSMVLRTPICTTISYMEDLAYIAPKSTVQISEIVSDDSTNRVGERATETDNRRYEDSRERRYEEPRERRYERKRRYEDPEIEDLTNQRGMKENLSKEKPEETAKPEDKGKEVKKADGGPTCFKCGKPGHFAKNCTNYNSKYDYYKNKMNLAKRQDEGYALCPVMMRERGLVCMLAQDDAWNVDSDEGKEDQLCLMADVEEQYSEDSDRDYNDVDSDHSDSSSEVLPDPYIELENQVKSLAQKLLKFSTELAHSKEKVTTLTLANKTLEDKVASLNDNISDLQKKLHEAEVLSRESLQKYEVIFAQRTNLFAKIKDMEDKFLKRDHTDQTIHMNQPKEFNYYNPKEGIGYKSPCYLKRAISKTPTLYDLSYATREIPLSKDYTPSHTEDEINQEVPILEKVYKDNQTFYERRIAKLEAELEDERRMSLREKDLFLSKINELEKALKSKSTPTASQSTFGTRDNSRHHHHRWNVNALDFRPSSTSSTNSKSMVLRTPICTTISYMEDLAYIAPKSTVQISEIVSDDSTNRVGERATETDNRRYEDSRERRYEEPRERRYEERRYEDPRDRRFDEPKRYERKPEPRRYEQGGRTDYQKPEETAKPEDKGKEVKKADGGPTCFKCGKPGHFAKNCTNYNSKYDYYKNKMNLAKRQDEGYALLAEDEAWLQMSSDDEERGLVCMLAQDDAWNVDSDEGKEDQLCLMADVEEQYSEDSDRDYNDVDSDHSDSSSEVLPDPYIELENQVKSLAQKVSEYENKIKQANKRTTIVESKLASEHALVVKFSTELAHSKEKVTTLTLANKTLEDKVASLNDNISDLQKKLHEAEVLSRESLQKYEVIFAQRTNLFAKIKDMEDKFLKRDHTDQTIHMNQPKEFNYYNPKEGIGYKSPCYLKRAISKTPTLYDLRYMSLGYKIIFMKESDDPEQLKEIEKKEKARKTKQSFPFNYSSLNASYATREIPLSKDYTPSHTEDEINQEVPILEKVYKDNQTFYERRIAKLEAELEDERRMSLREKDLFLSKINELEKALKSKSTPTASQSTFGTRDNSRHHHHRWNVNALDFRPSSTSSTNSKSMVLRTPICTTISYMEDLAYIAPKSTVQISEIVSDDSTNRVGERATETDNRRYEDSRERRYEEPRERRYEERRYEDPRDRRFDEPKRYERKPEPRRYEQGGRTDYQKPEETAKPEDKGKEVKKADGGPTCFKCGKPGHFAKNCTNYNSKYDYYKNKMNLAKRQDEGYALLAEDEAWLQMSSDDEERGLVCMLAQDDAWNVDSDEGKEDQLCLMADVEEQYSEDSDRDYNDVDSDHSDSSSEVSEYENKIKQANKRTTIVESKLASEHALVVKFSTELAHSKEKVTTLTLANKTLEDKVASLNDNISDLQKKLHEAEVLSRESLQKYEVIFAQRTNLFAKIKDMEDKFLKRDHTDQTIHMNQPKEFNYYNPKEGIGYKSPCYLKRAISKTPTLYDLRYMSLGYKIIFMKESDDPEQLKEIEKKEKARKTKQSFPFNYSSLNASYATREIPLSKDYTPSHTDDEMNQEVPILEKVYKDNQTFYERRIAKLEAELEDERRMSLREKDLFLSKINELEKALKSKSTPTASQSTFGTRDNSRHHHHRWNVNALDFRPSSTSSTNSKSMVLRTPICTTISYMEDLAYIAPKSTVQISEIVSDDSTNRVGENGRSSGQSKPGNKAPPKLSRKDKGKDKLVTAESEVASSSRTNVNVPKKNRRFRKRKNATKPKEHSHNFTPKKKPSHTHSPNVKGTNRGSQNVTDQYMRNDRRKNKESGSKEGSRPKPFAHKPSFMQNNFSNFVYHRTNRHVPRTPFQCYECEHIVYGCHSNFRCQNQFRFGYCANAFVNDYFVPNYNGFYNHGYHHTHNKRPNPKPKQKSPPKGKQEHVYRPANPNQKGPHTKWDGHVWYMDSGCSKHMTGRKELLANSKQKYGGNVRFGNKLSAPIMGYGDI